MATLKQNSEALKAITNKLKNLPKRAVLTDLVVTKNGDYTPEDENSGFKRVSVNVPSEIDALFDKSITEMNSGATKIMDYAFYNCKLLTSATFPNATSIGLNAFYNCVALANVNIPNATNIGSSVFYYCSKLTSVDFPNATSIGDSAFNSCPNLASVNIPNATKLGTYAFYNAYSLKSADFPKATSVGTSTFQGTNLTRVNFPSATSIGANAFQNCSSLATVDFQKVQNIYGNAFYNCSVLKSANFPSATSIGTGAFQNCYALTTVILRSETMCTLAGVSAFAYCSHFLGTVHTTHNPNADKDGYFYVPRALLSDDDATKDYRRATNWSSFSTQFRALEDYTVDGTVTGELDPNKI